LNISVHEADKLSPEAMGRLVAASEEIRFKSKNHPQIYRWVERVLMQQFIHLSGRDLSVKRATAMARIHAGRAQMLAQTNV
jgi:hypothetical protein